MPRKKAEPKTETRPSSDTDFLKELAADTGGQMMVDVGSTKYFIDTGNLALNRICSGKYIGGGIPGGQITEVYGPPASAKSLLGNCVLGGVQRMGGIAVYLDCERAGNPEFAKNAGHVDVDSLVSYEPISIEQVEAKIKAAVKRINEYYDPEKPKLFVWDSISVTPTEREWKTTELPETYTQAEFKKIVGSKERPGERAKAAGDALRRLNPLLNDANATLYVINQTRQAIGVMFGSDEVTGGGGKALPFYASCRLRTSATKHFLDEHEVPCGVNLNFRNKKNRSFKPFGVVEGVPLFFDKGINPLGGLLVSLKQANRIKGKGTWTVQEPWANGQKVTFKRALADGTVPEEVLLKCPSLIDAENEQQVKDYLGVWQEAIDLADSVLGEANIDDVNQDEVKKTDIIAELGLESEFDGKEYKPEKNPEK